MLYRSINVAIFVLVAWFSYVSIQATQSQNEAMKQTHFLISQSHLALLEKQQLYEGKITSLHESFDEFLTAQQTQAAEKKKLMSLVSAQKQVTRLHELYGKVLKADVLRASGQFSEAVAMLSSTKKEIWLVGDLYPKHQKALRASMQTIDNLVKSWTKKEAAQTAAPVYKALEKVLTENRGKS